MIQMLAIRTAHVHVAEARATIRWPRAVLHASTIYLAVTLVHTWPLARVAGSQVMHGWSPEDILLVIWILRWDLHALWWSPLHLFQGNILHPASGALLRSEHLLGNLPLFAPVFALTHNPVLAFNVLVLSSFALGGLFLHLLVLEWTGSAVGAYVAGLSFLLAPWRISWLYWSHLLNVQYLPLALLALDRTARHGRLGTGVVAGGLLAVQMLCSFYLAYMTAVVVGCWVVADITTRGPRGRGRAWRAVTLALAVPSVVFLGASIPYAGAHAHGELLWQWTGNLTAGAAVLGSPAFVRGLIGRLALLVPLALVPVARAVRERSLLEGTIALTFILATVAAFAISPGPQGLLHGWIAPYRWLAAIVPGFSLVRAPFRFAIVASLAASALAGWGVAGVVRALAGRPRALLSAVVASAVAITWLGLGTATGQLRFTSLAVGNNLPEVYRWLAANGDGGTLLELPVVPGPVQGGSPAGLAEAMAMYFSTYHWLPLVNGYTGYFPDSYLALRAQAAQLPNPEALQALVDCAAVRWIVLHADPDTPAWPDMTGVALRASFPGGRPAAVDRLYEVRLLARAPCAS